MPHFAIFGCLILDGSVCDVADCNFEAWLQVLGHCNKHTLT